jgi:hypothetical protein
MGGEPGAEKVRIQKPDSFLHTEHGYFWKMSSSFYFKD